MSRFKECAHCAEKPGTPALCSSCLSNRQEIWSLEAEVRRMQGDIKHYEKELRRADNYLMRALYMILDQAED